MKKSLNKLSDEKKQHIRENYQDWSTKQIAEKFNVATSTAYYIMNPDKYAAHYDKSKKKDLKIDSPLSLKSIRRKKELMQDKKNVAERQKIIRQLTADIIGMSCPACGSPELKLRGEGISFESKGRLMQGEAWGYDCQKCNERFSTTESDTITLANLKVKNIE